MVNSTLRRVAALATLATVLHVPPARGQSPAGTIQGTTVDPSGSAAAGVQVTAISTETGARRRTVTDRRGSFTVPGLPAGEYELVAVLPGFAALRQSGARVHAGHALTLRLELRAAPAPETMTLAGPPPAIVPTQPHVSGVVESTAIANLPARRRNALDLVVLGPGVTRNVRTGGINLTAVPAVLNRVLVDGIDAIGIQFGQEAVRELAVAAGAASAEYGSPGGTIHIVTNSGTNRFAGSVYEFYGNDALTATTDLDDRLGRPEPAYEHNQFGGALGGPLVKDEHFFFAAYDGVRATEREQAQDHDALVARSDHRLAETGRLALRYDDQRFSGGGTRAFSTSFTSGLGSALFNEVRFQYGNGRQTRLFNGADEATLDRIQFADTLTWLRGAHRVKGGVDVLLDDIGSGVSGATMPGIDEYAFFVQDEWRAREALTVNAGLRYDLQTFDEPAIAQTDTNNVGPRVGVAWAPAGRRYVVRGGYGLYYGRTPGARVQQANAGVEWEWMPHTTLAVNGLYARGDGLPDLSGDDPTLARPLTLAFARAIPVQRTAESLYDGLSVEVNRRFAQNHAYTLSYTFGRADFEAPASPGNFHRFVGSTLYSTDGLASRFDGLAQSLLESWMLSAIYSAQTGPSAWNTLDARIARHIDVFDTRLALMWEAFNLLNRANGPAIETRRPAGQNGPRAMQLAVRLSF